MKLVSSPSSHPASASGLATFQPTIGRPISLLLVADHAIERCALDALLQTQRSFEIVAEVQDLITASVALRLHRPAVVVMAVRMRGAVRVEDVRHLRAESATARIVALASSECETMVFTALDAGASEYVLRSADPEEFFAAIRRVHAGTSALPPNLRRLARRPRLLTARELEVLDLMRRGMTDREIGLALTISPQTAKSHAKSIFAKLEAASRAEAVAEGFERGLLAVA